MQIQFNIDNSIEGHERTENYFAPILQDALKRYEDKITRLEVHLADENGEKSTPDDKRCLLEARVANLKPIAVTNHADTVEKAIKGATDKLKNALEHSFGKLQNY
jgi:ribosome-associated translation inhibitor RaiA